MELRNLHTFIKVCENMSFSKAAEQLGYTQSAVTTQIGQLEAELDVKLFDRRGKRFRLNERGEQLLAYANRLVALAEEAKTNISDTKTPKGVLRLGVIESIGSYFLPDILLDYLESYPQVRVEVRTATTREIMELLRQNQLDMILTLDDKLYEPDWHCAWSQPEDIIFLCAPDHPLAGQQNVPMDRLIQENLILTEKKCNYRKSFERICAGRNLLPAYSLEIGCTNTILRYTARGIGITFLPNVTAQRDLAAGRLSFFTVLDEEIQMYIQLIYRKSKWCSPAMQAFVDKLAEHHRPQQTI